MNEIHKGYFSIDKKGHCVDSKVKRGSEFSDDISAYDLILKNKERLLSFEEPTRFIFSHSALREGWDNPNVFQICTLKHSDSTTTKRQEVGRGLRLCVNKEGNRMDFESCGESVHDINKLTVIASESYKDFVGDLQKQIKTVLYDRPTKATVAYFEGKTVPLFTSPTEELSDNSKAAEEAQTYLKSNETVKIDNAQAKSIYLYLYKNEYIDNDDNVTDKYRNDLATNNLAAVPEDIKSIAPGAHRLVQAIFDDSALDEMIGKVAQGTTLTRRTTATILKKLEPSKLYMFRNNPEEFISKVIALINEQKATTIVEHIQYNTLDDTYDSGIFTDENHAQGFDKAYRAEHHIQDYVFTDGTAEKSIERQFAEDLDHAQEVCVYAKLPRAFHIPTPVGNYAPDWAIAFKEGTVKHIYFIAETKGTMNSLELRPIEKAKLDCAKKLFNEASTSEVRYHNVDTYQELLNVMNKV